MLLIQYYTECELKTTVIINRSLWLTGEHVDMFRGSSKLLTFSIVYILDVGIVIGYSAQTVI